MKKNGIDSILSLLNCLKTITKDPNIDPSPMHASRTTSEYLSLVSIPEFALSGIKYCKGENTTPTIKKHPNSQSNSGYLVITKGDAGPHETGTLSSLHTYFILRLTDTRETKYISETKKKTYILLRLDTDINTAARSGDNTVLNDIEDPRRLLNRRRECGSPSTIAGKAIAAGLKKLLPIPLVKAKIDSQ